MRVLAVELAREPRRVLSSELLPLSVLVITGLPVCIPARVLAAAVAAVPAVEPCGVLAPEMLALPVRENGIIATDESVCCVRVSAEPPWCLVETERVGGSERLGDRRELGAIHFIEANVDDIPDTLVGSSDAFVGLGPYAPFRNNVERKPPWRKARTRRQTSAMMKMTASEM